MSRMLRRLLVDESGQDLVEYALLAALLATVSITALTMLGHEVYALFRRLTQPLPPVF